MGAMRTLLRAADSALITSGPEDHPMLLKRCHTRAACPRSSGCSNTSSGCGETPLDPASTLSAWTAESLRVGREVDRHRGDGEQQGGGASEGAVTGEQGEAHGHAEEESSEVS